MKPNIVYIFPEANVGGQKRTVVLRSRLGLAIAASLTPNFGDTFEVHPGQVFRTRTFFESMISGAVEGQTSSEVGDTLNRLERGYNGLRVKEIPANELMEHTYAAFFKAHPLLQRP